MRRLYGSRGSGSRQDALLLEKAADPHAGDADLDVLAAYKRAKRNWGANKKKKEGPRRRGGGKVGGGGQILNGSFRKTGLRNRRYRRDSEYHLASRCPWRDTP